MPALRADSPDKSPLGGFRVMGRSFSEGRVSGGPGGSHLPGPPARPRAEHTALSEAPSFWGAAAPLPGRAQGAAVGVISAATCRWWSFRKAMMASFSLWAMGGIPSERSYM